MADSPYLDAFPSTDNAQWRTRVEAVLKGKSAETLSGRSYDGISVAPLYPPAETTPVISRAIRGWSVLGRVDEPDAGAANSQALEDLGNGADGLHLAMRDGLGAYGFGLTPENIAGPNLLTDIVFDAEIPVELDALDPTGAAARALAEAVARHGANTAATRISFGVDLFGALARGHGEAPIERSADLVRDLRDREFGGPVFVADARLVHAAGGSEAQELAYALAAGVETLRRLDGGGLAPDVGRTCVSFRVAVDPDEFLGVAKLRALRRLWERVEESCGLAPKPLHLHAETAWRSLTRRDPDVNMLRATLAVFSAAVGGADRISVLPHTQALGLPDAFARRVARNTQLVLREEANLDKVADPAAGSGGFEALTTALCEKAWAEFQTIEAAGGLAAALRHGAFRTAVAAVAEARRRNVAKRRDGITGVSEFPALTEVPPNVESPCAPAAAADMPFAPHRLAAPFEALRDRSDERLKASGHRPRVFLATLGTLAASTPRTMFAKNLFEAGGLETVAGPSDAALDAIADAFKTSGARIACLCSSDAVYAGSAVAATDALRSAGATSLVLAGRPGELEQSLRAAGVTDFAYVGADVLALLTKLADVA